MIGAGFLEGNWEAFKEHSAKVHLIEPVLEGVLQMFFQYIILYIIYGPGTSIAQSKYLNHTLGSTLSTPRLVSLQMTTTFPYSRLLSPQK